MRRVNNFVDCASFKNATWKAIADLLRCLVLYRLIIKFYFHCCTMLLVYEQFKLSKHLQLNIDNKSDYIFQYLIEVES